MPDSQQPMHDNNANDEAAYREWASQVSKGVHQIISGPRGNIMAYPHLKVRKNPVFLPNYQFKLPVSTISGKHIKTCSSDVLRLVWASMS